MSEMVLDMESLKAIESIVDLTSKISKSVRSIEIDLEEKLITVKFKSADGGDEWWRDG